MKKGLYFAKEKHSIIEVVDPGKEFEVHSDMVWIDVPDDCTSNWTVVDGTPTAPSNAITDKHWEKLRSARDVRLARCDWTQSADAQLSADKKAEWQVYRQALRDIPANTTDPRVEPTWPTKPS